MSRTKISFILIIVLLSISTAATAWGASGSITITSPPTQPYFTTTSFTVSGTYVLSSDDTPNGTGTNPCIGTQDFRLYPYFWSGTMGASTWAELHYKIDGNEMGLLGALTGGVYSNPIGKTYSFSCPISVNGLDPDVFHMVTIYFTDIYGAECGLGPSTPPVSYYGHGDNFGDETFTFKILTPCDLDPVCCKSKDPCCPNSSSNAPDSGGS